MSDSGPTPEILNAAKKAGLERGDSFSYVTSPMPKVGDRVRILKGAFAGEEATINTINEFWSSPIYASGSDFGQRFTPDELEILPPEPVSETKSNREIALQIAFNHFTSDADGLTADEAMDLADANWNDRITHWQPFENESADSIQESIEELATVIQEALDAKDGAE